MKRFTRTAAAVALAIAASSSPALAQNVPNCPKPGAPQRVEGQVVAVDAARGTMTVRAADGTTHEFQASRETLQDMKVGDKIEAKLRPASANCK
jgi:hypothetical protein